MSTDLFNEIEIGHRVRVVFSGGIDGEAFGRVIAKRLATNGDFKIRLEKDFRCRLGPFHRAGTEVIVHGRELKEILPAP